MEPISSRFGISRRVLLSTLALLPAFSPWAAMAQQAPLAAFSFAVYGDSRPMMYLPYKEGQPELNKMFVEIFGLVMSERIAEAVVKRDVKMIFDPVTKELVKVVMPFASKSEVMTLTLDKGWVTEAATRRLEATVTRQATASVRPRPFYAAVSRPSGASASDKTTFLNPASRSSTAFS